MQTRQTPTPRLYSLRLSLDREGTSMSPIQQADELLAGANLPTYSQTIEAMIGLAKGINHQAHVDRHMIFKAWVLIDRYSTQSKHV
jgi:hypothetical protein